MAAGILHGNRWGNEWRMMAMYGLKITADNCNHEVCYIGEVYDQPRRHITNESHYVGKVTSRQNMFY